MPGETPASTCRGNSSEHAIRAAYRPGDSRSYAAGHGRTRYPATPAALEGPPDAQGLRLDVQPGLYRLLLP